MLTVEVGVLAACVTELGASVAATVAAALVGPGAALRGWSLGSTMKPIKSRSKGLLLLPPSLHLSLLPPSFLSPPFSFHSGFSVLGPLLLPLLSFQMFWIQEIQPLILYPPHPLSLSPFGACFLSPTCVNGVLELCLLSVCVVCPLPRSPRWRGSCAAQVMYVWRHLEDA